MRNAIIVMILLCLTSVTWAQFPAGEPVQTGDPDMPKQVTLCEAPAVVPQVVRPGAGARTTAPIMPRAVKAEKQRLHQCLRIAIVRHDYCGEQAIRQQIAALDARLAWVEQNPLGGEAGQQKVRVWLCDNGYATHYQCRVIAKEEIAAAKAAKQAEQIPASAGTETSPALASTPPVKSTAPVPPAERGSQMDPFWYVVVVLAAVLGIVAMIIYQRRRVEPLVMAMQIDALQAGVSGSVIAEVTQNGQGVRIGQGATSPLPAGTP